MTQTSNTGLSNRTFDIVQALSHDADFLYDTVNAYIRDAQSENRQDLVDMWTKIKQDRERHVQILKDAIKKEFHR